MHKVDRFHAASSIDSFSTVAVIDAQPGMLREDVKTTRYMDTFTLCRFRYMRRNEHSTYMRVRCWFEFGSNVRGNTDPLISRVLDGPRLDG